VERDICFEIAVGVDLDLVARGRVEGDLAGRRLGVEGEDQDRAGSAFE
jgi:hypothetical protein